MAGLENATILETIVTPDGDGLLVQLRISDVSPPDAPAAIRLNLAVSVPAYESPLLTHLQREAIERALSVLRSIDQELYQSIDTSKYPNRPEATRA